MTINSITPRVSCVMLTHNAPDYQLHRAIKSVLNQTLRELELIIVIDNPDFHSGIKIVKEYALNDSRVRYHINEKNFGVIKSRNIGLGLVRSGYIIIHDQDDESLPHRFETLFSFMENNPHIDMCGSALKLIYEDDNSYTMPLIKYNNIPNEIKRTNPMHGASLIFRLTSFNKYGGYQNTTQAINRSDDYGLVVSWFLQGANLHNLEDILLLYHYQSDFNRKSAKSLLGAIKIKWACKSKLNFKFANYLYFLYDFFVLTLITILPKKLYLKLTILKNA